MSKLFNCYSLFLILIFYAAGPVYCQILINKDSLITKLEMMKEQTRVKGILAGMWKEGQEVFTTALGESMTSVPAGTDMHVRIGGVSEIFLGTLLMILSEKGKIDLNGKISQWLPGLIGADSVTSLMLIKNTAGYKDYVLNKDFTDLITKEPFRNISHEEIISYAVSDGQLNFPPGTSQHYSHTEFTILGNVLEKATGKSMPELYEEYIFRPLGLKHTGYSINPDLPEPVLHAFSSDRGIYEDATFWNPSWTGDSGPLYSTLHDLGVWANAFGKGKLLTNASFSELISRPEHVKNPDIYIASGFAVANGWYFQNPSFNGYSGAFGYLPSQDLTIIIYTTESVDPKSSAQAFNIFKEIVKMIAPENVINF